MKKYLLCLIVASILATQVAWGWATWARPITTNVYGEMYNYSSSSTPYSFDIDTAGVYYNLTGLGAGNINGFTFTEATEQNGGSYLTAQHPGLYLMSFSMSFSSEAQGGLYGISIGHNWNPDTHRDCYARRAAASAVGNVGVTCLMDIERGDNVSVLVENENGNRDMYIHTVNLNVVKIANIP